MIGKSLKELIENFEIKNNVKLSVIDGFDVGNVKELEKELYDMLGF